MDKHTFSIKNKKNKQYIIIKIVYIKSWVSKDLSKACKCLLLNVAIRACWYSKWSMQFVNISRKAGKEKELFNIRFKTMLISSSLK